MTISDDGRNVLNKYIIFIFFKNGASEFYFCYQTIGPIKYIYI